MHVLALDLFTILLSFYDWAAAAHYQILPNAITFTCMCIHVVAVYEE